MFCMLVAVNSGRARRAGRLRVNAGEGSGSVDVAGTLVPRPFGIVAQRPAAARHADRVDCHLIRWCDTALRPLLQRRERVPGRIELATDGVAEPRNLVVAHKASDIIAP